eukprot:5967662-Pyramimonas_sp.AAC.2
MQYAGSGHSSPSTCSFVPSWSSSVSLSSRSCSRCSRTTSSYCEGVVSTFVWSLPLVRSSSVSSRSKRNLCCGLVRKYMSTASIFGTARPPKTGLPAPLGARSLMTRVCTSATHNNSTIDLRGEPPLLRLVLTPGIYRPPCCDWFSRR